MPEKNPGSAPDPSARPPKVWETGEALDESRIPGTRRLWLAGTLLVAVLASTVTAVYILEGGTDTSAKDHTENTISAADDPVLPSPPPAAPPTGKSGLSSVEPSGTPTSTTAGRSTSPDAQQAGSGPEQPKPAPRPSKPAASDKPPAAPRKSVQSVNYPDRFWHVSQGAGRLDQVSSRSSAETRQDATFKLVPGLADSTCYSFSVGDGRYLRHYDFRLRADRDNGSQLFEKDATFCPRPSSFPGAVALESVNYPGLFVRHRDFRLRLDRYENSNIFRADSAFRLVQGLG